MRNFEERIVGCRLIDLTGRRFGKYQVLHLHSSNRKGGTRWMCLCDCGKQRSVLGTHLRRGNSKSCGCGHLRGKNHPSWKGYGDISAGFWATRITRSGMLSNKNKRGRPIEVGITIRQGWNLFLKQKRKCALSGVDLYFPEVAKANWNASLDRIDSSKGYIRGNVQWVDKDINMMKRIYDQEYFIKMCKLVAKTHK